MRVWARDDPPLNPVPVLNQRPTWKIAIMRGPNSPDVVCGCSGNGMQFGVIVVGWIRAWHDTPASAIEVLDQSPFEVGWSIWILSPADSPNIAVGQCINAQELIGNRGCPTNIWTKFALPTAGHRWHHVRTAWICVEAVLTWCHLCPAVGSANLEKMLV